MTLGAAGNPAARERLIDARRVFLDTAPVIYFAEANPGYIATVDPLFRRLDEGTIEAVVSPVTLAECLIHPIRHQKNDLAQLFITLLTKGASTRCVPIDDGIGHRAAELRARENFTLTDALQLAAAESAGCDLFLTNDSELKRGDRPGLRVVTLDDLALASASGEPRK